jgi:hypothetical protein
MRLGNRFGKRTPSPLWSRSDGPHCIGHAAKQAQGFNPLEHTHAGQGASGQQKHHSSHLAGAPTQAAFDQAFQTLARPKISGEAHRCGGRLSDSTTECDRALCRREKPNSSVGSHPTGFTAQAGALRHLHSRDCLRPRLPSLQSRRAKTPAPVPKQRRLAAFELANTQPTLTTLTSVESF